MDDEYFDSFRKKFAAVQADQDRYGHLLSDAARQWSGSSLFRDVRSALGVEDGVPLLEGLQDRDADRVLIGVFEVAQAVFDVEDMLLGRRMKGKPPMEQRNIWESGYCGGMMTRPLADLVLEHPSASARIAAYVRSCGVHAHRLDLEPLRQALTQQGAQGQ